MEIRDDWKFDDAVTGLKLSVKCGTHMNRLHIEPMGDAGYIDRDFFFTKDGKFDGTGSTCAKTE